MGTAADFLGEIPYGVDGDAVAVLVGEQPDRAGGPGLFHRHFFADHGDFLRDLFVDERFHPCDFLLRQRAVKVKVEAQPLGRNVGAALIDVGGKHFFERRVQEMRRRMQIDGQRLRIREPALEALFAACVRFCLMRPEGLFKTLPVHLDCLFFRELLRDFDGEAEGVVQAESGGSVDDVAAQFAYDAFKFL